MCFFFFKKKMIIDQWLFDDLKMTYVINSLASEPKHHSIWKRHFNVLIRIHIESHISEIFHHFSEYFLFEIFFWKSQKSQLTRRTKNSHFQTQKTRNTKIKKIFKWNNTTEENPKHNIPTKKVKGEWHTLDIREPILDYFLLWIYN